MISTLLIKSVVFLATLFFMFGLCEAFVIRSHIISLNKEIKPLYRANALHSDSSFNKVENWFNKTELAEELSLKLHGANVNISPFKWSLSFLVLWLVLGLLTRDWFKLGLTQNLVLMYAALKSIELQWLKLRQGKLAQKINVQLPEVCRSMASGIRAGLSVQQSIEMLAKQIKPPAGDLYMAINRELKLGMVLDVVLEKIGKRVNSKDLKLLHNTIIIQRRAGGNLSYALDHMAKTLEERERINQELKNATAESKYVALILSFFPVIIILFLSSMIEGFLKPLFTIPGIILLVVVLVLILTGLMIVRKTADIKV